MTENRSIAAHLPRVAAHSPTMAGVVCPPAAGKTLGSSYSFGQLEDESNLLAAGLLAYGIGRGQRTVLMVPPSLPFFALCFALFKRGAIPVLIDPGMGLKNLKQCLHEAQPHAFIGVGKAHLARLLLRWPKQDRLITVGRRLGWGGIDLSQLRLLGTNAPLDLPLLSDEDEAAILFTSGSTGVPKGANYSHGTFQAQVTLLRDVYGIQPGEVDLATFPLFALFAPALGMTAIIPRMDFTRPAKVDPEHILGLVKDFNVTNMFGSPALLNRVARYGAGRGVKLTTLNRVISAGAPVSAYILKEFSSMLPATSQIFTPYGATEALPICSIGSHEILADTAAATAMGKGVCVGLPVPGVSLKVIAIKDDPIDLYSPELDCDLGLVGEIAVKGPMVTRSYFNRVSSTRLAKMRDPVSDEIWHRMGDLGYLDAGGRLWFCGRKCHRLLTAQGPLYSVACEGIFNCHEQVYRTALVGIPAGQGFVRPVLCVELENLGKIDRLSLRAELLELGASFEMTRNIKDIRYHPCFPVDIRHNAKIFREKLALWASKIP